MEKYRKELSAMKLTFIGSSHGVPEAHRKCSCLMVEVEKNIYFVDMGTSVIEPLQNRGIPVDAVKGIFISHMHGDHINGLVSFVDLLNWFFRSADPTVCLPDLSAAEVIRQWLKVTLNNGQKEIRYAPIHSGEIFNDGLLKVTAFPTLHCPDSFAFLLEAEGKSILYTGDLNRPGVDFPQVAQTRPLDLVICEAAHFPATEYQPILEKCQIHRLCVTHYSPRYHYSALELAQRHPEVFLATDDLEISL